MSEETRHLTTGEQRILRAALRRSSTIIDTDLTDAERQIIAGLRSGRLAAVPRDFGEVSQEWQGTTLTAKALAPGLDLHALVCIYDEAAKDGSEVAGNPSQWPVSRGVKAVTEAVVNAMLASAPEGENVSSHEEKKHEDPA